MNFLALSYSIPANPSRYRVAVWKALKELGAVYLQPAVAIVPEREGMREALAQMKQRVLASGGTAALLSLAYLDEADEKEMIAIMQAARTEEYDEIAADARRLLAQLDWEEGQPGGPDTARYTLECRRLRRRLGTAVAHDFLDAPGRDGAVEAMEALAARLPKEAEAAPEAPRKAGRGRPALSQKKTPAGPRPKPPAEKPAPPAENQPEEDREPRADMPVFLF